MRSTPTEDSNPQRRVTRACDNCKSRRTRCELPENVSPGTSEASCQACIDSGLTCKFDAPVRKRGPQPGSRKRVHSTSPHAQRQRTRSESPRPVSYVSREASTSRAPSVTRQRLRQPFGGVPSKLIDQLLPLYFTHVHNVWPLIYKATFNPHTTSAPLLLSMLAIASCVTTSPASEEEGFPADRLFRMAEQSLHECRNECRIDLIQSLLLLSLRQTGCGDKQSAFTYAGRACCMALNMGLNLTPGGIGGSMQDGIEKEIRSRVYWNTYVLDKTLSEETGRPFLLTYRRSTTPLPSTEELEELETWPPPTLTATVPGHRAVHIIPRRGHIMSCFAWTCRLAMIVEDILDLEPTCPPSSTGWDKQFLDRTPKMEVSVVSDQLDRWRASLPPNLDVIPTSKLSPLPHHAVGIAWYHTSRILLHSRFIKRTRPPESPMTTFASSARQVCSEAAQATINILSCLDKFQLLNVASSDVLHILSLTALFEAFETTSHDPTAASLAKANFAQCCRWLRDFSSSWPAASSHRLFFEGLIKGGLQISSATGVQMIQVAEPEGQDDGTPSTPDGLRQMRRNLSISEPSLTLLSDTAVANIDASPVTDTNIFQLPQLYWNSWNTTSTAPPANPSWDSMIDFNFGGIGDDPFQEPAENFTTEPWAPLPFDTEIPLANPTDSAAVQSALMNFMMEAARGGQ